MKTLIITFLLTIIVMLTLRCSSETSTNSPVTPQVAWDDVLYDLPNSISNSTAKSKSIPITSPLYRVYEIYNGVRSYVALAEEITRNTKSLVTLMYNIHKQLNFATISWTKEDNSEKIKFSSGTAFGYDWRVEVWKLRNSTYMKAGEILYSVPTDGKAKGKAYFDSFASEGTEHSYGLIEFDSTDDTIGRKLKISLQCDSSRPDNEPQNVVVECLKKDNIISVMGNSWIPALGWVIEGSDSHAGDVILGTASRNYVFQGVADNVADYAKVDLALCDGTLTTNDTATIFNDWSFGKVSSEAVAEYIALSRPDCITYMQSFTSSGAPTVSNPPLATEVKDWFGWYVTTHSTPDAEVWGLVYMFNLVNSAYFDQYGFIGNGSGSSANVGSIPTWYNNYQVSSNIHMQSPADVVALNVNSLMDHTAPDF